MSNVSRHDVSDGDALESASESVAALEHVTAEYEDGPNACTMYPRNCTDHEIATHWITAETGSYVDLSDMR
ncbi:hypothetical protein HALLA_18980 [Halostagnicola larsenii XH-48]|uniref:DUF7511 domain-containing protein n=1 Tax=Halostagnicola larsenii XH-48 TaxID=797299 RepID=W0JPB0_9EURY|nr:hypothetical protein [Halostagnicola larsenii]AHG00561.1 hypothetical protein HALLA_18980 [Halostagnicola larsenii XH-48]